MAITMTNSDGDTITLTNSGSTFQTRGSKEDGRVPLPLGVLGLTMFLRSETLLSLRACKGLAERILPLLLELADLDRIDIDRDTLWEMFCAADHAKRKAAMMRLEVK